MANIECWLGSFVIFQRIGTGIAKKPYIFVIFQGGPDPLSRSLDPHMVKIKKNKKIDCCPCQIVSLISATT